MLVYADGSQVGTIGGGEIERQVTELAIRVIGSGQPARFVAHLTRDLGMCCGGDMEVYVEPLTIKEPFLLFGAGHVAHALAPLLKQLEFAVTVVDARDELLTPARFPHAERKLVDPVAFAEALEGTDATWSLIVTHDHHLDQVLCETLLPKPCAWIGMIGSRAKVAKFMLRLRAAGITDQHLSKLCAPVGLDIGAETPAEIAVSIAAELVRVRRQHQTPSIPLSAVPLPARGGDGIAHPPRQRRD